MVNIDPKKLTRIIRNIYGKSEDKFIPLHEPRFISDEKEVLKSLNAIKSRVGEIKWEL